MSRPEFEPQHSPGWWPRLLRWIRPRAAPFILVIAGVAVAGWIAYRSSSRTPPTATESAVLSFGSATLSLFGGFGYARIGRADPSHARSAVRNLGSIALALLETRGQLASAVESGSADDIKHAAETATVVLMTMDDFLDNSVQDWNEIHHEALREVLENRGAR